MKGQGRVLLEPGVAGPFLKWPGGKRWFARGYRSLIPIAFERYIEPFMGSASVFFSLQPANAILSDANAELIDVYRALKSRRPTVEALLGEHARKHSDDYYYKVRADEPADLASRAARTIYLNRTCFNGIYRVNLDGMFNVPRGTKNSVLLSSDNFSAVSKALRAAELVCSDFEAIIDRSDDGDLVFADPPYTVRHNTNGFIKYNEKLFSWADQERLAKALRRAEDRGVKIVATNANHASVRELYGDHGFELTVVSRFSSISAAGANRKQFEELVIRGRNV